MTPESTTTATIRVELNGSPRDVPARLSIRDLIVSLELRPELVVAEVNREILPRESYAARDLSEGDVIELVHFVGGG